MHGCLDVLYNNNYLLVSNAGQAVTSLQSLAGDLFSVINFTGTFDYTPNPYQIHRLRTSQMSHLPKSRGLLK